MKELFAENEQFSMSHYIREHWNCPFISLYFVMNTMKIFKNIFFLSLLTGLLPGQEQPSIHQREWEFYRANPELVKTMTETKAPVEQKLFRKTGTLSKVVYGFHPYWMNGSEGNYDFSLLTHLAYFSGDVDPTTGNFATTNSWSSAAVVTKAKQKGIKVHFTITQFSNHAALFNSPANKLKLVNNIIAQINLRSADGCNVDVEGTSSFTAALADSFRFFIKQLGDTLHAHGKELAVELPAVDWSSGWIVYGPTFFNYTKSAVDYYFLMAYDYWWSGSANAGPVAPLQSSSVTSAWHSLRSVNTFLSKSCPPEKLIAGFPYYGYDWPTSSSADMATASGSASSRTYTVVKNNYIDTIPASRQFWSATYNTRFYKYISGATWRQTWYDDSLSLKLKYDSIKTKNIGGVGMWALGYDGAEPELWNALRKSFVTSVSQDKKVPVDFQLEQNYPNPFNPATTIRFTIPISGFTTLKVYDVIGREVAVLVNEKLEAGVNYQKMFDASQFSSGLYIARLQSNGQQQLKKMMLLK